MVFRVEVWILNQSSNSKQVTLEYLYHWCQFKYLLMSLLTINSLLTIPFLAKSSLQCPWTLWATFKKTYFLFLYHGKLICSFHPINNICLFFKDSFTFYPSSHPRMSTLTHHNSVQCHYHSIFQFHPYTLTLWMWYSIQTPLGACIQHHDESLSVKNKTLFFFSQNFILLFHLIIQIHPTPYPPLTYHVHALPTSPTCLQTFNISCKLNTQIRIIFNI